MRRWPRRRPSWRPSDIVRPDAGLGPVSSNQPPTAHPAASAPPEAAVGLPARPTTRSSAPTGQGTPTDPAPAERAEPPHAKRRGPGRNLPAAIGVGVALGAVVLTTVFVVPQGFPVHHEHRREDRKSTRLNSSHVASSSAVFCPKK